MKRDDQRLGKAIAVVLAILPMVSSTSAQSVDSTEVSNPISQLARWVNPKLVKVEDKLTWLEHQSGTLAKYSQYPLHDGLGYRGARLTKDAPDPTIVMDLGKSYPISSIYLVPAQSLSMDDPSLFPKALTIETSVDSDFKNPTIVYKSGNKLLNPLGGIPLKFTASRPARYVKLSVQTGHQMGVHDMFALSEIFVIANDEPVSLGATVKASSDLDIPGLWYPQALVDGRTPLGIWHHGKRNHANLGDAVITQLTEPTTWKVTLPKTAAIDRIVLFPYQVNQSAEFSILPDAFRVEIPSDNHQAPEVVYEWRNPSPLTNHPTPWVIPMNQRSAKEIQIVATAPWMMGNRRINALSEIEIWSQGKNLISGIPVLRLHDGTTTTITSLTDGQSSEYRISPIPIWLEQLAKRGQIDKELTTLRKVYQDMETQTELTVSWGSAVLLGLTTLIPVFIVERRRMKSKENLDLIRKRIASDLHDDIGSNLGSISLIARTARKDLARLNGPPQIDEDLGEVETIARESSLAMRDIVWLLERKQDTIDDLVHRMRETAGRLLREIQFTLECSSTRTSSKLSLDAKRHLFLFFKEAMHNVLKHAKATQVAIRMWDEGDQLALEIQDNGIGLPVTKDRMSIGIKKLEDRAEVLNGLLQVTSSAETGTCIRLLVKRSDLTTHASPT